jgi:hypothetical protein
MPWADTFLSNLAEQPEAPFRRGVSAAGPALGIHIIARRFDNIVAQERSHALEQLLGPPEYPARLDSIRRSSRSPLGA